MNSASADKPGVLFLSCWYPTEKQPNKGIFIREHAKRIAGLGYSLGLVFVDIHYGNTLLSIELRRSAEKGFILYHLDIRSVFHKFLYQFPYLVYSLIRPKIIHEIVPQVRPSLIHGNVVFPAGFLSASLARETGIPLVLSEHWSGVGHFLRRHVFSCRGKRVLDSACGISVVSRFLKEEIAPFVRDPAKIIVNPNPLDPGVFTYRASQSSVGIIRFTCVGFWKRPKRLPLLLEAVEKYAEREREKRIELCIIGQGPQLEQMKAGSVPPNMEIIRMGHLSQADIAERLATTDFFLHASDTETFSIVTLEALFTGVPVIASDVGALPELIDETNGILCENTPDSWVEAIEAAARETYDRNRISEEARKRFHPGRFDQGIQELYGKCMKIAEAGAINRTVISKDN